MQKMYTAIDANINRALEGLRVCEDVLRFIVTVHHAQQFKEIRHHINNYQKKIDKMMLLNARDVAADKQKFNDLQSEIERKSIVELFSANIHRAMEAARVLEEINKLEAVPSTTNFQSIRFSLYQLEKEIIPVLQKNTIIKHFHDALYGIIDSSFIHDNSYESTAQEMIDGGVNILQLRMKNGKKKEMLRNAKIISSLCKESDCIFIVNDHPDIAILSQADGVHLGQDDLEIVETRKILPEHMIIGISTHSYDQAVRAYENKSDYIAIGPLFKTKSKNGEMLQGIGLDSVKKIASTIDVPLVGIGGITDDTIADVKIHGCNSFAVISALYQDGCIKRNCQSLVKKIQNTKR